MRRFGPFLELSAILYEDQALIAVNKPSGMTSQAVDPAYPDDVATRLSRLLEDRDGRKTPLGIHQRLDRDTSGVLVFAKSPEGNRALSAQFEARSVRKEYLAAVRGYRGGTQRLEHRLGGLDGGRVAIDPRGKPAIATIAPVERSGDRALVRVHFETGRTHQIRVQLAAVGAPIAGDPLYGRTPAPRLMLHSHRIVLTRPLDASEIATVAKVPSVFRAYLAVTDLVDPAEEKGLRSALRGAVVAHGTLFKARSDARAIDALR